MKRILLIACYILALAAILFNFTSPLIPKAQLLIGAESSRYPTVSLAHQLVRYPQASSIVGSATENKIDGFWINGLDFIENYSKLHTYKLIASIKDDYWLIYNSDKADKDSSIGAVDITPLDYLVSRAKLEAISVVHFVSYEEALQAYLEKQVDYVLLPEVMAAPLVEQGSKVRKKLSDFSMGYAYFAISEKLLQEHTIETILPSESSPSEEGIIEAIRWLFSNGRINSRYYYKDFVTLKG